nr:udp-glycosyltransferase 74f2 [Quercus suber]
MKPRSSGSLQFDTISDGYDEGGFTQAENIQEYHTCMVAIGSKTLADLIIKHKNTANPIDCIIYDPFVPWALEVAKNFGIFGAAFFTQTCAVNFIYYQVHCELLKLPITSTPISIPGLPVLELEDMPSFISMSNSYPSYLERLVNQFSNSEKADAVLVNTFYELEVEVVDSMSKFCRLLSIGPTIPSFDLDNLKASEEAKLPEMFVEDIGNKGLVVQWSPQLEVLANKAIGCFLTHCGWNPTLEALSLGVPLVGMPQWTDQIPNSKFVQDVWKMGVRSKVGENGIVGREEIEFCIREVMEGEK